MWKSPVRFYSHSYFTRVWVIQEISTNLNRKINVGFQKTVWNRVDLVASYIIMEPAFSDVYGFSGAYCWWVATVAELIMQPKQWLNTLYVASNYGCLDARDVVFGLRGLMELPEGEDLLAHATASQRLKYIAVQWRQPSSTSKNQMYCYM
jgi:hypothetical protein